MINPNKFCLFTNDVETTSIVNHRLSDQTGERVLKDGMPKLLDLYERYHIKSTFFFTAHIAKIFPEIVRMILPYGHEVACHGYTHQDKDAFDSLTLMQQIDLLKKSKDILEQISGKEVISFRAPALRVGHDTSHALLETGFLIDSSTSSQRLDMIFSYGSQNKRYWIFQPRLPYNTDENNIWRRGSSVLYEIPVSAAGLPYTGTFLRIFPSLTCALRHVLHWEAKVNKKPIVFLIHPNELIHEEQDDQDRVTVNRRSRNFFNYLIKDVLRQKMKNKNLGINALHLLEREIIYFNKKGYEFSTLVNYYKIIKHGE